MCRLTDAQKIPLNIPKVIKVLCSRLSEKKYEGKLHWEPSRQHEDWLKKIPGSFLKIIPKWFLKPHLSWGTLSTDTAVG